MHLRADVKVGYACNNNCLFCVIADKRKRGNLKTAEVKRQLEFAWNDGARDVVLTGGEVTIRKDVFEIVAFARNCGFEKIQIQTNGRMLSNYDFAQKLVAAGATEFGPSLHGSTAQMHDSLVQCKGAFEQTVQGMKNAKLLEVPTLTNTVITKANYLSCVEIARLLLDLGADQFQLAFVHPQGNAYSNFGLIVPRISLASGFMKKALDYGKARGAKMMVEAVPHCLMAGYEEYCSEKYIPKSEVRAPGEFTPDFENVRKNEGKAKGEGCKKCRFFAECEGPWREYPEKRGWKEFQPCP